MAEAYSYKINVVRLCHHFFCKLVYIFTQMDYLHVHYNM